MMVRGGNNQEQVVVLGTEHHNEEISMNVLPVPFISLFM